MTEEEAKKRWCPFARVISGDDPERAPNGPYNRDHWITDEGVEDTIHRSTCIASDCMAWRVEKYIDVNDNTIARGFCGLAGQP